MNSLYDWLARNETVVHVLIITLVAALFFYIGSLILDYLVKKAVKGARGNAWHRKDIEKRQKTLAGLFVNIWRIIVVAVALYYVVEAFVGEVSLAPLFASAGIIGVALGFGSQTLLKDFLSGIFIITENQYRVGDTIDINGSSGVVERIGTRSTVIRDDDGNVHYFPNGTIQHVINKTMGYSKARFTVTVKLTNELDEVIDIINKAGLKLASEPKWKAKIIDPPAFVSIGEVKATTIDLLISGKTQPSDQWSVTAELRRRLLTEFEKNSIEFGA